MNLPNAITLGRMLAVPVVVWLILEGRGGLAFWVFVGAGISDAVDGALAKRFDLETELGRHLDPLADKLLLAAVYLTLGHLGLLPSWIVILVVSRDAAILGGAILASTIGKGMAIQPLLVSKVNTAAQIVLAGIVLAQSAFDFLPAAAGALVTPLVFLVATTTALSGATYLARWGRWAQSE